MYHYSLTFDISNLCHLSLLSVHCNSYPMWISSMWLLAPPKIAWNQHNIRKVEVAILDVYRYHISGSLYNQIKKSAFWGIMHDGISKFYNEFNGVYLHGINE